MTRPYKLRITPDRHSVHTYVCGSHVMGDAAATWYLRERGGIAKAYRLPELKGTTKGRRRRVSVPMLAGERSGRTCIWLESRLGSAGLLH